MKEVTIYDIAKHLNISATTVSRGLKDHPSINKKTKKKIVDIAKELGYRSNTFASSLRSKRTHTIGIIVPRLNSHFMSAAIAGMENVANEEGYHLLISQSLESTKKEIDNAHTMFTNRVDGLIASLASDTENNAHFEAFVNKNVPVIFFDRVFDNDQSTGIVIDNLKAGYEVTKHLLQQGCKRIMHLAGNTRRNVYEERLKGYKRALKEYHIPFDESLVQTSNLSEQAGTQAGEYILNMQHRPDGIFAANDICAVFCMLTLLKAGIRVPQDIAIAGFNNDPISQVVQPNLTTISYPGYEMGKAAASCLIDHLSGRSDMKTTNKIILSSELIIRGSSLK